MAEWSMAVVLKTGRIGYDIAVIFCGVVPSSHLRNLAIILPLQRSSESKLITDRANATLHLSVLRRCLCRNSSRPSWTTSVVSPIPCPGKSGATCNLIAVDSSGEVTQGTRLFRAFLDYIKALEAKNEGPLRLSRMYVSGHSDPD
jgi:hypothetical protein